MNDNYLKPGQPTDSEPHQTLSQASRRHDLPDATEIAPGVTLRTRDGLQIGNAIVVRRHGNFASESVWLIETDFGNTAKLTDSEINSLFVLGKQDDYDRWWQERIDAIHSTVNESAG